MGRLLGGETRTPRGLENRWQRLFVTSANDDTVTFDGGRAIFTEYSDAIVVNVRHDRAAHQPAGQATRSGSPSARQ